jgi:hypothetical protein
VLTRPATTLVIACGAIAHEVTAVLRQDALNHVTVTCLPPELHNRPEKIPAAVAAKLADMAHAFDRVFVAYADCGTGGQLDALLDTHGIERIPGAHCYEFFAGANLFAELSDAEPGTFYLTDFLARNFQRLIVEGLGMAKHPELRDMYFGNYNKLVYLQQRADSDAEPAARAAAAWLNLEYEKHLTGYGQLEVSLESLR